MFTKIFTIATAVMLLMAGCSNMNLTKGDLEFSHSTLFQDSAVEDLKAHGVNGMDIEMGKHSTDAQQELLKAILENML